MHATSHKAWKMSLFCVGRFYLLSVEDLVCVQIWVFSMFRCARERLSMYCKPCSGWNEEAEFCSELWCKILCCRKRDVMTGPFTDMHAQAVITIKIFTRKIIRSPSSNHLINKLWQKSFAPAPSTTVSFTQKLF